MQLTVIRLKGTVKVLKGVGNPTFKAGWARSSVLQCGAWHKIVAAYDVKAWIHDDMLTTLHRDDVSASEMVSRAWTPNAACTEKAHKVFKISSREQLILVYILTLQDALHCPRWHGWKG